MAILAIFTAPGFTKEMYEAIRKEIDWEHDLPPGGVFHAAGWDDAGGVHVADVWESPETLNAFVSTRLMPAMQKLNAPQPKVEVYPAHNIDAYGTIDQYKV